MERETQTNSESTPQVPFGNDHEFQDEVHGAIYLNRVERDVVDTPEFRRLFQVSQLGLVRLLFPAADHTRGAHSIGACAVAKELIKRLNQNNPRFKKDRSKWGSDFDETPTISTAEAVLISLGALLHDIPHGPFSHDIERKTHRIFRRMHSGKGEKVRSYYGPYNKHDDFANNPALFVLLMDPEKSILARVLRHYSRPFWQLLQSEKNTCPHVSQFLSAIGRSSWSAVEDDILPTLVFHLLVFEDIDHAAATDGHAIEVATSFDSGIKVRWGIGPEADWEKLHRAWYQPYRHDIIGNTLSADLLDYLRRDQRRLGMDEKFDLKLLDYYVLAPDSRYAPPEETHKPSRLLFEARRGRVLYRSAIDLNDYKRGTIRDERINDVFRLLDLRHQIHEKAVYHRVVQSGVAMLSRAVLIIGRENAPSLPSLYGIDMDSPALATEEHFLLQLLEATTANQKQRLGERAIAKHSLPQKIAERRVYRPLMVVPGYRVLTLLGLRDQAEEVTEHVLRELATVVDCGYYAPFFLFASWCIEKLLEHAIPSEAALDKFIADVADDDVRLNRAASGMVPKRVIFWTTPYKQLYKDPNLLVQVQGTLETIDRMSSNTGSGIPEPLRKRVGAGIRDAEVKNEALWKLYVFISDGLFYTGPCAKLINAHPCGKVDSAHREHLEVAQKIAVRAIRCAWFDWEESVGKDSAIDLQSSMGTERFRELLLLLHSKSYEFSKYHSTLPAEISSVVVDHYLHGRSIENCRDIRYKFDSLKTLEDVLDSFELDRQQRDIIAQVVRASGRDLGDFGAEELEEIVARLSSTKIDLKTAIDRTAARDGSVLSEQFLSRVWLEDLAELG